MKLSVYMQSEINQIDKKYLLEAADSNKDSHFAPLYWIESNEVSSIDTLKKIGSVAACVVLAVAVIIAFVLIRNSITTPGGDDPADSVTDTDEDGNKLSDSGYGEITEEERQARREYGYINSTDTTQTAHGNFVFGYPSANSDTGHAITPRDILFYDVTNMTAEPMSVFLDAIGDLPFEANSKSNQYWFDRYLIDEYATDQNNGIPVLIMSIVDNSGYGGIYLYDMATRKMILISDEDPYLRDLQSLGLYGDTVYYTYSNGNEGSVACSIKLDGSDYKRLHNEKGLTLYTVAADEDYVFFHDNGNIVYKADTDLENVEEFCKSMSYDSSSVCDGYFFYISQQRYVIDEVDGQAIYGWNLVKKPVDSTIEDAEEIVCQGDREAFFIGGKMYMKKYGPGYYGGWYSETENAVIEVDLKTGEQSVVFEYAERDDVVIYVKPSSGNSLMFYFDYFKDGKPIYSDDGKIYMRTYHHYNIKTGVLTEVFVDYYA